jgi:hypothetical protein
LSLIKGKIRRSTMLWMPNYQVGNIVVKQFITMNKRCDGIAGRLSEVKRGRGRQSVH